MGQQYGLQSVCTTTEASKSGDFDRSNHTMVESQASKDRDREELESVGKKQVLKRNFGFMSMLGFSCTLMSTWEGLLASFVQGLENGGPAGLIYGFIICWIGTLSIIACLAELASMAPTAGGQYHWVAMLSPRSCQKFFSYIAGWFSVIAWQASLASILFPVSLLVQGLLVLNQPDYVFERWHGTLICYALLLLALFVNTYLSKYLSKLEGMILVVHILGFFAVLVPLVYLAPHGSAEDVFTTFINEGGWSTQALSFFVGLNTGAFAFSGADGTAHMAEEIQNASTVVPWTMMTTVLLNGVLGFSMLIAILFCIGNVNDALNTPTGFPFIEIFVQAIGTQGSTILTVLITMLGIFGCWANLATASRQMWAFSRDNGLPGSRFLARVHAPTSLPLYSIGITALINLLLPLINIGSPEAFGDLVSLLVSSFYLSFILPCFLLLWCRTTGRIANRSSGSTDIKNTPGAASLSWGPWRMPARMGFAVNIIACIFGPLILIFSFWPQVTPVTPDTMNFSVLVTGATMLGSLLYYFLSARKIYVGPVIEISGSK